MKMHLTEEQITLLEESFARVSAEGSEFAEKFYERLFRQHPEIEPLFGDADMDVQASKLLSALNTIVSSFKDPETLRGYVGALGIRHETQFMVSERDYRGFKEVLMETFAEYCEDTWTPELHRTWSDAFDEISRIMTGK